MSKILIIDDNKELLDLMSEYLLYNGFEVMAFNGITDCKEIENTEPELIILDLEMPGLTGFQILEYVRNDAAMKDVPVIIITGLMKRSGYPVLALAQHILDKPFKLEDLLELIGKYVN